MMMDWTRGVCSPLVKPTISSAVRERHAKTLRDTTTTVEAQTSQFNSRHWDDRKAWWAAVQAEHENNGEHKLKPHEMTTVRRHAAMLGLDKDTPHPLGMMAAAAEAASGVRAVQGMHPANSPAAASPDAAQRAAERRASSLMFPTCRAPSHGTACSASCKGAVNGILEACLAWLDHGEMGSLAGVSASACQETIQRVHKDAKSTLGAQNTNSNAFASSRRMLHQAAAASAAAEVEAAACSQAEIAECVEPVTRGFEQLLKIAKTEGTN